MEKNRIEGKFSWFSIDKWNAGDIRIHVGNNQTSIYCVSDAIHNDEWITAFTVAEGTMFTIQNGRAKLDFGGTNDYVYVTGRDVLSPNSTRNFVFSREECAKIVTAINSTKEN